jgi:hypothetical protein
MGFTPFCPSYVLLQLAGDKMLNPLPIDFVKTLAQKLRDNQLVLFVGAGLSRQATPLDGSSRRLPSWNEFLSKIAASFGLNPDDYQMDPLTVLDYVEKVHKRHKLNDAVRSIGNPPCN